MAEEAQLIGGRMRERRKELGLTQREVAERIPGSTEGKDVSRWEGGHHRPQGDTLGHIATALETTVADLYSGPMADREEQGSAPDPFATERAGARDLERLEKKVDDLVEQVSALGGELARVAATQGQLLRLVRQDEQQQKPLRS